MPRPLPRIALSLALVALTTAVTASSAYALTLAEVLRRSREGASAEELLAEVRASDPPLVATPGELALLEASDVDPRVIDALRPPAASAEAARTPAAEDTPAPAAEVTPAPAAEEAADAAVVGAHRRGRPVTVDAPSAGGWVLGGGMGGNVCFADSDGTCQGLHVGFAVDALVGYRFDWLTLSVDVQGGFLVGAGDETTASTYTDRSVMAALRLNLRAGPLELQLGGGFGYVGQATQGLVRDVVLTYYGRSTTDADGEWHAFTGGKVLVGVFVADVYPRLDVGLVGTLVFRPNVGKTCYTTLLPTLERLVEPCDAADAPVDERVTITLQMVYRFPN